MFRNNRWLVVLAACLVAVASAQVQSITELLAATPSCAMPCVMENAQEAGCNLLDIATLDECACTNITLQHSLSACVQTSCGFNDQVQASGLLADLCVDYPKESRSGEVKAAAVACIVITTIIVLLRFLARLTATKQLWWDDAAILLATLMFIAMSSIKIASSSIGFGMHYWTVDPSKAPTILQNFYVTQMLYILIQVTAKAAILILFSRIFTARWFSIAVKAFICFLVLHSLIFLLLVIMQCLPVEAIWDKSLTARCMDITSIGWAGAVFAIVEDLVILAMPISEVLKLQLSLRQRIAVVLMFSIGSFACVTSMVRLKYMVDFANSFDATWDNVDVVIWSIIELACAIICGSLPALRPLLARIPKLMTSRRSAPSDDRSFGNKMSPTGSSFVDKQASPASPIPNDVDDVRLISLEAESSYTKDSPRHW